MKRGVHLVEKAPVVGIIEPEFETEQELFDRVVEVVATNRLPLLHRAHLQTDEAQLTRHPVHRDRGETNFSKRSGILLPNNPHTKAFPTLQLIACYIEGYSGSLEVLCGDEAQPVPERLIVWRNQLDRDRPWPESREQQRPEN
jgi:hypothetical protein